MLNLKGGPGWTDTPEDECSLQEAGIKMPVTLLCPNLRCRAVLQVPDTVRGKTVRCGHCGTVFAVPAARSTPAKAEVAAKAGAGDGTADEKTV